MATPKLLVKKEPPVFWDHSDWGKKCRCDECVGLTYDHLHCYTYNFCDVCHERIWYNSARCKLYSRRMRNAYAQLICFDCRWPFYKCGIPSGPIHLIYKYVGRQ